MCIHGSTYYDFSDEENLPAKTRISLRVMNSESIEPSNFKLNGISIIKIRAVVALLLIHRRRNCFIRMLQRRASSKRYESEEQQDQHDSVIIETASLGGTKEAIALPFAETETLPAWEDKYFEDRGDVLAVFDHVQEVFYFNSDGLKIILGLCFFMISSLVLCHVPFMPVGLLVLVGGPITGYLIGTLIAKYVVRKAAANPIPTGHTAVTEFGLRHVQLAYNGGSTLLIPFHDIQTIEVCSSLVSIRTPSVDMCEYVEKGLPTFTPLRCDLEKNEWNAVLPEKNTHSRLYIMGLREPYRLKKLLLAMKEKHGRDGRVVANALLTQRVLELLEQENVPLSGDHQNALFVELRDELRHFNNNMLEEVQSIVVANNEL